MASYYSKTTLRSKSFHLDSDTVEKKKQLHIVMKVALFLTKNRNESSTFFHLLGNDCQIIPTFFKFFLNPFRSNFSTCNNIQKNNVHVMKVFFSLICLINSGYVLVNQIANS
jgi:hypothetical protein